ncbi:MAG: metallophosphoesterase [Bacteroidia bacterium]|nr:metallophosphoesterase [Bacteroidia bacterium]
MNFHTIATLAFVIPNVYLILRIGQLFINKGYRFLYALIYLFIVAIYPFATFISAGKSGIVYDIFSWIASYYLPFYLYMFLCVLLFDIFLLINWPAKLVRVEKMKSTRFKFFCMLVFALISTGVVFAGAINFNTIRTTNYHIEIPKKSSDIDHLKIAFASDFHLKQQTDIHFVERFVTNIAAIQPDLMIFGGDVVEGRGEGSKMDKIAKMLSGIHAKYGVYAVLGNHESYGVQAKGHFFDKAGMQSLCDSVAVIGHSFNLAGRYDDRYRERKKTAELLKSINGSLPVILIDHRPTDIEENSKTVVDVQFSGHTHNGQMFPLNLILASMYRLSWGYEKIGHTHFFVSSGIMLWGPPVRTTGKSEIMVVEVDFR